MTPAKLLELLQALVVVTNYLLRKKRFYDAHVATELSLETHDTKPLETALNDGAGPVVPSALSSVREYPAKVRPKR